MTTSISPASPFKNEAAIEKNAITNFTIHTMKDDLASLQKGDGLIANDNNESTPEELRKSADSTPDNGSIATPKKTEELPVNKNPFTESFRETKTETKSTANINPFGATPETKEVPFVEVPVQKKQQTDTTKTAYKFVLSLVVMLTLSIIGLGGYYFWITQNEKQAVVPQEIVMETPIAEPVIEEEAPIVIAPAEKYSVNNPNYLVIDLATADVEEINKTIQTTATDLVKEVKPGLYEFLIVDKNNNPVAFPIFATASKINFSSTLLSSLDKNFSLFIHSDGNDFRLGLAIDILKDPSLVTELKKQEKTMAKNISLLFPDKAIENKTGVFNTATYNNTTIHYLNDVDTAKNLSIDYAIVNSQLIVGTSKDTGRALVDKSVQSATITKSEDTPAQTQIEAQSDTNN